MTRGDRGGVQGARSGGMTHHIQARAKAQHAEDLKNIHVQGRKEKGPLDHAIYRKLAASAPVTVYLASLHAHAGPAPHPQRRERGHARGRGEAGSAKRAELPSFSEGGPSCAGFRCFLLQLRSPVGHPTEAQGEVEARGRADRCLGKQSCRCCSHAAAMQVRAEKREKLQRQRDKKRKRKESECSSQSLRSRIRCSVSESRSFLHQGDRDPRPASHVPERRPTLQSWNPMESVSFHRRVTNCEFAVATWQLA